MTILRTVALTALTALSLEPGGASVAPTAPDAAEATVALGRTVLSTGADYLAARAFAVEALSEAEIAAATRRTDVALDGRAEIAARAVEMLKSRSQTYLDLQQRLEAQLLTQQRQRSPTALMLFALAGLKSPEAAVLFAERLLFENREPEAPSAFWSGARAEGDATPPPDAWLTRRFAAQALGELVDDPFAGRALFEALRTEPLSPLRQTIASALEKHADRSLLARAEALAGEAKSPEESDFLRQFKERIALAVQARERGGPP